MLTEVRIHRTLTVLLAVALLATLSVALTGGDRADAVEGPVDVVYVTTGRNFPDALAGGTLAATTGAPMLTVEPQLPIPAATIAALQSLDPDRIVIFGGPVAVSDAVRGALADYARSGSVTRIEGGDRHDTAAQIADALPNKVHDADRLDGLDSSAFLRSDAGAELSAVFGSRDRTLGEEPLPTTTVSIRQLAYTAPTDGFLQVTASIYLQNEDGASRNRAPVFLLHDWDGGPLLPAMVAADDILLQQAGDPVSRQQAAMTTAFPVTAGSHTIDIVSFGTDITYDLGSISAVFSPNGAASAAGTVDGT